MKVWNLSLALLLGLALALLAGCDPAAPDAAEGPATAAAAKSDVCHYDAVAGTYHLITVADPALDAHIAHGDAHPGEAVPTMAGYVFDAACVPQQAAVLAIDQNQPNGATWMAFFSQTDLAQSFQTQQADPTAGAGIFLIPGWGITDDVRISLWTALPNAGGVQLAEGTATGTQGEWVDVFWTPVALTPNTTYYLVFDGNTTLGITGDMNDPYPFGHVYANPGYESFLDDGFDYTFRTWISTTAGMASGTMEAAEMRASFPSGSVSPAPSLPATLTR